MNGTWGPRVDFITSNATKAGGDDRKVVRDRDDGGGYAKGNLIGNHFRTIGNIECESQPPERERGGPAKGSTDPNGLQSASKLDAGKWLATIY